MDEVVCAQNLFKQKRAKPILQVTVLFPNEIPKGSKKFYIYVILVKLRVWYAEKKSSPESSFI